MCGISLCTRGALDTWSRGRSTAALGVMFSRVALGFLIAPLVVPIGMLLTTQRESHAFGDLLLEGIVFAAVWYFYPLLFALVFALPLYLLLQRSGRISWWAALGAGLLIGAIGAMSNKGQSVAFSAKLVLFGGIAGLVFWMVVGARGSRVPDA